MLASYTSQEAPFVECIKVLLEAGADKSLLDEYGQSALSYAKDDDHDAAIALLS